MECERCQQRFSFTFLEFANFIRQLSKLRFGMRKFLASEFNFVVSHFLRTKISKFSHEVIILTSSLDLHKSVQCQFVQAFNSCQPHFIPICHTRSMTERSESRACKFYANNQFQMFLFIQFSDP